MALAHGVLGRFVVMKGLKMVVVELPGVVMTDVKSLTVTLVLAELLILTLVFEQSVAALLLL